MFELIDKTVGLRVSSEEEMEGLDFTEHGGSAYPDFASTGGMGIMDGSGLKSVSVALQGSARPVEQT